MGRPGASVQIRHEAANEPSANSNSAGSPAAAAEGSGRSSSVSNASGQSGSQFASANSGSAPVNQSFLIEFIESNFIILINSMKIIII